MVNTINPVGGNSEVTRLISRPPLLPTELKTSGPDDIVDFGSSGKVSPGQAQGIVLERAYEQLRAVVGDARADLGIPEGVELDTSPDATANRIADFAIGFFSKYAKNNGLEDNEEGRAQFAKFIGGAIETGIGEARDILGALSALSPQIDNNINQTASVIKQRLDDFVKNGIDA
ncbi:MAG: DUF5610 domain-containing protein [Candidatus Hydrogenedentes bacterium]|nr:DUF5610 domain-containing protein [Candidatus Hydrogenedentota bacterium]